LDDVRGGSGRLDLCPAAAVPCALHCAEPRAGDPIIDDDEY
jgi:hypothetical protein